MSHLIALCPLPLGLQPYCSCGKEKASHAGLLSFALTARGCDSTVAPELESIPPLRHLRLLPSRPAAPLPDPPVRHRKRCAEPLEGSEGALVLCHALAWLLGLAGVLGACASLLLSGLLATHV